MSPYEQRLRQAEVANLKLRRYYKYHAQVRAEIGQEVEEAMHTPDDLHESLTEFQTRPTKIIPLNYDLYKTQPLPEMPAQEDSNA
jgi:hypothetical protein